MSLEGLKRQQRRRRRRGKKFANEDHGIYCQQDDMNENIYPIHVKHRRDKMYELIRIELILKKRHVNKQTALSGGNLGSFS